MAALRLPVISLFFCLLAACSGGKVSGTEDKDGDGYLASQDCDDEDPLVHPGAEEICADGKDNDCVGGDAECPACGDGLVLASGCSCGGQAYSSGYCCEDVHQETVCEGMTDADDDGYDSSVDCDDSDPDINPGADEICGNGVDEDCLAGNDDCPACVVGEPVPDTGCTCGATAYHAGHCCEGGWQGTACGFVARTCAEIGVANCVEVWPGQDLEGYEYHPEHRTYFFRDVSNQDHYFLLMGDIDCDKTCAVFGFQDGNPDAEAVTTFDLNGYQLTYSAAGYSSLPNNGFEEWEGDNPAGWTVVSGTVEARSTAFWMPMSGEQVLYTGGPVVLESSAVHLPAARAYHGYVTVGRAQDTDITLEVLDAGGNLACSQTKPGFFRGQSFACRFDTAAPGDYRIRLTTQDFAYFDMTGIVPINDYGVGVFTSWSLDPGNNNQNPVVQNLSGVDIPASGDHASPDRLNQLEVMNGRIVAGHENQNSTGVYLSGTTRLHLHDVTILADGLKSHSVRAAGDIHDNHLEVNMPWYFARENSDEENVILVGGRFHNNTAIGGQGVIRLRGSNTEVSDNYIRNNAQATNHYAIIHSGAENPDIHGNVFDPIEGSGILTYVGHGYRIYDNTFYVRTATCNVEYLNEDYSTNAIRMNDYGAQTNYDNWVFGNTFHIVGEDFETAWDNCMPVTTGIFYSASGADNRIFDNHFTVIKTHADETAPVFALYMGGDAYNNPADNPLVTGNTIETNDKAAWITTYYGDSSDLWLEDNTFVRLDNEYYQPSAPDAAIRMGRGSSPAHNLRLINNHYQNGFEPDSIYFTAVNPAADYELTMKWYLHVTVLDAGGQPVNNALVRATSAGNDEIVEGRTGADGLATLTLTEYTESGDMTPDGIHARVMVTPHAIYVQAGASDTTVDPVTVDQETSIQVNLP